MFGTEDDTVATAAAQDAIKASKARQRSQVDRALRQDLGSKAGMSALGPDGLRFAHLQCVLATAVGKAKLSEVIRLFEGVLWRIPTLCRRNFDFFFQSICMALDQTIWPIFVGSMIPGTFYTVFLQPLLFASGGPTLRN